MESEMQVILGRFCYEGKVRDWDSSWWVLRSRDIFF